MIQLGDMNAGRQTRHPMAQLFPASNSHAYVGDAVATNVIKGRDQTGLGVAAGVVVYYIGRITVDYIFPAKDAQIYKSL